MSCDEAKQDITKRRLIEERNRKKLTQEELANEVDISLQSIKNYEREKISPNIGAVNLCNLADFYGVSVDYLLGRTNHRTPDMEISAICEKLGLSEGAVEMLWVTSLGSKKNALDKFIKSPYFEPIIEAVDMYQKAINNSERHKVIKLTDQEVQRLRKLGHTTISYYQEAAFHISYAQFLLAETMKEIAKEGTE